MELTKINHYEKDAEDKHYEATEYELGEHVVTRYIPTDVNKEWTLERFDIEAKDRNGYLPQIYFDDGFYGEDKKWFEIQTTSYGALTPDKIKEVIAGYEEAMEAVAILTKEFIK